MRAFTRVISASAAAALLLGTSTVAAQASPGVLGGWTEGNDNIAQPATAPILFSMASSAKHTGKAESKVISGTSHKRSHGWTSWAGTRHYTTAQLVHYWPSSGVITSSGRKWGTGGTEAYTKWVAFNPNAKSNGNGKAKTFYGK